MTLTSSPAATVAAPAGKSSAAKRAGVSRISRARRSLDPLTDLFREVRPSPRRAPTGPGAAPRRAARSASPGRDPAGHVGALPRATGRNAGGRGASPSWRKRRPAVWKSIRRCPPARRAGSRDGRAARPAEGRFRESERSTPGPVLRGASQDSSSLHVQKAGTPKGRLAVGLASGKPTGMRALLGERVQASTGPSGRGTRRLSAAAASSCRKARPAARERALGGCLRPPAPARPGEGPDLEPFPSAPRRARLPGREKAPRAAHAGPHGAGHHGGVGEAHRVEPPTAAAGHPSSRSGVERLDQPDAHEGLPPGGSTALPLVPSPERGAGRR